MVRSVRAAPVLFGAGNKLFESRFEPGLRQRHEWSCGHAALANLLSVFFGCATDEDAVTDQERHVTGMTLSQRTRWNPAGEPVWAHFSSPPGASALMQPCTQMDAALLQLALAEVRVPVIGLLRNPPATS